MPEEKYIIGKKEFVLREDLSFDELDLVEKFTNPFKAENKATISGGRNITNAEIKNIIKILVKPIDSSTDEDFNFGELTPEQSVVIVADFLKKKAQENIIMKGLSEIYRNGQGMHLPPITA